MREEMWNLVVQRLEDGPGTFEYFAYIMTKHSQSPAKESELRPGVVRKSDLG